MPADGYMQSAWRRLLRGLTLLMLLEACAPKPNIPVETLWFANESAVSSHCLFVFLPGRWDTHTDFLTEGFVASVREHRLPVDMLAANLHIGYYKAGSALERLHDDVIVPSQQRGYSDIWLVGVSVGGMGSLSFEARYPHVISGIVLLGPYLGDVGLAHEIEKAGGILAWNPKNVPYSDYQRRLWEWIQRYATSSERQPPIYLGFGTEDRLSESQRLLATVLPPGKVDMANGGHDWKTWKLLWDSILERLSAEFESCAPPS